MSNVYSYRSKMGLIQNIQNTFRVTLTEEQMIWITRAYLLGKSDALLEAMHNAEDKSNEVLDVLGERCADEGNHIKG